MITAQQMAERFPPALLASLSRMADEIRAVPLAPCNGQTRSSARIAETWTRNVCSRLTKARQHHAFDEDAIRDFAENYARQCREMSSYQGRAMFAGGLHVAPPSLRRFSVLGACRRLDDPRWWRRQLRKSWTRRSEDALREIGIIRAGRSPYASEAAVGYITRRQARQREWMDSISLVSEDGESLNMLDVHDRSLANPALRRGEFMCRLRGFEELAAQHGHDALF